MSGKQYTIKLKAVFVIVLICFTFQAYSVFTAMPFGFFGYFDTLSNSASWGDYDNDGDLDFILVGKTNDHVTRLFRNDNAKFTELDPGIIGLIKGNAIWADFDNDGDLDVFVNGQALSTELVSKVYRNEESGFVSHDYAGLIGIWSGVCFGKDFNRDGFIDLFLGGRVGDYSYTRAVFRNAFPYFVRGGNYFPPALEASASSGDYDNDGDEDILLQGMEPYTPFTRLMSNAWARWLEVRPGFVHSVYGNSSWGDYDNDGDLDVIVTGSHHTQTVITPFTKIYRNDEGIFTDIDAGLTGLRYSVVEWGDYDNDGDLDIVIAGKAADNSYQTYVYRNDGGVFTDIQADIIGAAYGFVKWGDFDNDGDLDILLNGFSGILDETGNAWVTRIYRNDTISGVGFLPNHSPYPPANLTVTPGQDYYHLTWDAPLDDKTPASGLSYALRVGTTPGGCDIVSPHALVTGYRQIPERGMINGGRFWKLKSSIFQPGTTYYFAVQAIDTGFAGSAFSGEFVLDIAEPLQQKELLPEAPATLVISAYPNPFQKSLALRFSTKEESFVTLDVFDIKGRHVSNIKTGRLPSGSHGYTWDGCDGKGNLQPAGLYLVRLKSAHQTRFTKVVRYH
jgi:hypothetical protein